LLARRELAEPSELLLRDRARAKRDLVLRVRFRVSERPSLRGRERHGRDEQGDDGQGQRPLRPHAAPTLNRLQNGIRHRLERSGGEFSP